MRHSTRPPLSAALKSEEPPYSVDVDSQALYATHVRTQRTADFSPSERAPVPHTHGTCTLFAFFRFCFPVLLCFTFGRATLGNVRWTDSESSEISSRLSVRHNVTQCHKHSIEQKYRMRSTNYTH